MKAHNYYGVPLPILEEGELALGVIVSLKIMNSEGKIGYHEYKSPDVHSVEALGMLETFTDSLRMQIMGGVERREE